MPDVSIEIRGDWLNGNEAAFALAVHHAIAGALASPVDEPVLRLKKYERDQFLAPRSAGERFTRVEIVLFEGRTLDAKRRLYRSVVEALVLFGVPPEDVKIILLEVRREDVGFRGGNAACDVDLGYSVVV